MNYAGICVDYYDINVMGYTMSVGCFEPTISHFIVGYCFQVVFYGRDYFHLKGFSHFIVCCRLTSLSFFQIVNDSSEMGIFAQYFTILRQQYIIRNTIDKKMLLQVNILFVMDIEP